MNNLINSLIPQFVNFHQKGYPQRQNEQQTSNPINSIKQQIIHSLDVLYGKTNLISHNPEVQAFPKDLDLKHEFPTQKLNNISEHLREAMASIGFQFEDPQMKAPNLSTNSVQTQEINPNMIYRQQAILRYKQKKLRACNQIAYECRKIVADSRPRLKGRFISKEEQHQIQSILDGTSIDKLLNEKKNINLKKIVLRANLFTKTKINQKKINRESIQNILGQKNAVQQIIMKKIQKRQQIFQIETI